MLNAPSSLWLVRLRKILTWVIPIVFFAAWTLYALRPWAGQLSTSTYYDWGDGLLNGWILQWNLHQLAHDPSHLFDGAMFYPLKKTLALSENLLGLSLLFAPLNLFTSNTMFMANFIILFSFFSLGVLGFAVVRRWTGNWWLGMIGGFAIAFAFPRLGRLPHLQLLSYQPMLVAIFFAHRWVGRWRKWDAVGFFVSLLVQFYFGIYLFVFTLVVLSALMVVLAAVRWRSLKGAWRRALLQGTVGCFLLGALIYPAYRPYKYVRDELGIQITLKGLKDLGVNPTDFLHISHSSKLYTPFVEQFKNPYSPTPWEHDIGLQYSLYGLGFVSIGLGIVLLAFGKAKLRGQPALWLGSCVALLVCILLAMGPVLHLGGRAYPNVWMLYRWYFDHFPGFTGMRVPSRFCLPITVTWVVMLVLPLGWVWRRLSSRKRLIFNVLAAVYFLGLLAESRTFPVMLKPIPTAEQLPPVINVLKHQPWGPMLIWPLRTPPRMECLNLYYMTYHWYPTMNGYSGHLPYKQGKKLDFLLETFPDEQALCMLEKRNICYLLVQGVWMEPVQHESVLTELEQFEAQGRLELLFRNEYDSLWRITASRPGR